MLRAHRGEPGEAVVAGHVQVEQHQVDLRPGIEQREHLVQRAGFGQIHLAERIARRLPQCGAEQRMVVGDEQGGHGEMVTARSIRHRPGSRCR